jgi:hypothetical protein
LFEEIVVGALGIEFFLASIETRRDLVRNSYYGCMGGDGIHVHHAPPDIHLSLNSNVLKGLLAKAVLAEGLAAPSDGAASGTRGEYSVHAGLAHLVVAFRVDEESHVRVEIPRGLADGADLYERLY